MRTAFFKFQKDIVREAFKAGLISNSEFWMVCFPSGIKHLIRTMKKLLMRLLRLFFKPILIFFLNWKVKWEALFLSENWA